MNPLFRIFHRKVAPWLVIPLLIALSTGIAYRLGRAWFHLEKELGWKILDIHTGEWLGHWGSAVYVGLTGLGLLAMIFSGATLLWKSRAKLALRVRHRVAAGILLLPLTASAITGLAYKFGEEFFHISDETQDVLMMIHQGSWLGKDFAPFYVLFVGLGLLFLLWTGMQMTGVFRKKPAGAGMARADRAAGL